MAQPRPASGGVADPSLSSSSSLSSTSSSMEVSDEGERRAGLEEDESWTDVETRVSGSVI